jgi:hypothetical protein
MKGMKELSTAGKGSLDTHIGLNSMRYWSDRFGQNKDKQDADFADKGS